MDRLLIKPGPANIKPVSWLGYSWPQLLPNFQEIRTGKRRKLVIDNKKEKSQAEKNEKASIPEKRRKSMTE